MTRRRLASAAAFWFAILALVLLFPQPSHASLGSFFSNLANRVGLTGTPGRMVLSFEDGRTYEGDTVNEKPHGSGVLVMPGAFSRLSVLQEKNCVNLVFLKTGHGTLVMFPAVPFAALES
jgi:hypothetical protein